MSKREQQLDSMLFQATIKVVEEEDMCNVRTDAPPGTLEYMTHGDAPHREFSRADIEDARRNRGFDGWRPELITAFIRVLNEALFEEESALQAILDEASDDALSELSEKLPDEDITGTAEYAEVEKTLQRLLADARKATDRRGLKVTER
jgi:hypothetical protein